MASLEDFLATLDLGMLEKANGWVIRREGVLVRMTLRAGDGAKYTALIVCDGYPTTAPSVRFVDAYNNPNVRCAWPNGTPEFLEIVKPPPNSFLCMPLIREGLQWHNEWRTDSIKNPWTEENTIMDVFNFLERLLNGKSYTGRLLP